MRYLVKLLTILGKDSNDGGVLVDVLDGVLNLKQASIRVESGRFPIVSALFSKEVSINRKVKIDQELDEGSLPY